jgi:hypothetical protein
LTGSGAEAEGGDEGTIVCQQRAKRFRDRHHYSRHDGVVGVGIPRGRSGL